jgi:hypothetical protein
MKEEEKEQEQQKEEKKNKKKENLKPKVVSPHMAADQTRMSSHWALYVCARACACV